MSNHHANCKGYKCLFTLDIQFNWNYFQNNPSVNQSANQMRASFGCYGGHTITRQNIDNQWEDAFRSNQKSVCIQCFVCHSLQTKHNKHLIVLSFNRRWLAMEALKSSKTITYKTWRMTALSKYWNHWWTIQLLTTCCPLLQPLYAINTHFRSPQTWPEVSEEKCHSMGEPKHKNRVTNKWRTLLEVWVSTTTTVEWLWSQLIGSQFSQDLNNRFGEVLGSDVSDEDIVHPIDNQESQWLIVN